jgi:hypothetical protein
MNAHDLIYAGYNQLGKYLNYFYGLAGMPVPQVPFTSNGKTVTAFCSLAGKRGKIVFEVHETPGHQSLWICAPHPDQPQAHLWYEFVADAQGNLKPKADPHLLSTAYPWWQDIKGKLDDTKPWCNGHEYPYFGTGDPPPHWSPVFVVDDPKNSAQWDMCKTVHDWANGITGGANPIHAARPFGQNLTDRAMKNWPTFTLRGYTRSAGMAGGDWGSDHSTDYIEADGSVPTGSVSSNHGVDWDMNVAPDHDCAYMTSNCNPGAVETEIEAWALEDPVISLTDPSPPLHYRTPDGVWVQVLGRWSIDCGHPDPQGQMHAEMHWPELIAWSKENAAGTKTHSRVNATGAWLGGPLHFVVFAPNRPSATAILEHSITFDKKVNANLDVVGYPADDPNHLICRVTATNHDPILLFDNGMVGMTGHRMLHAQVDCWWNEPTVAIGGKATVAGSAKPASGTKIFFYDPDDFPPEEIASPVWNVINTDANGNFSLAGFKPKSYMFRPAGSGWDFHQVPKAINLADVKTVNFTAQPETYKDLPPAIPPGTIRIAPLPAGVLPGTNLEETQLLSAAKSTLAGKLISWNLNLPTPQQLGVKGNDMGFGGWYQQKLQVDVHLASFVDGQGHPVLDLENAIIQPKKSASGAEWYLNTPTLNGLASFINGSIGPGVANAKLRIYLVLGNAGVHLHQTQQLDLVTDKAGNASVIIQAGTHPEDVSLHLLVLENPVNPWFTPSSWSNSVFFIPGDKVDDSPAGRVPYKLTANLQPSLVPNSPFMLKIAEKVANATTIRAVTRRPPAVKAASQKSLLPLNQLVGPLQPIPIHRITTPPKPS